jgi:hypothetical protein
MKNNSEDIEFVKLDPRRNDPNYSYGIVEMPQDDEVLYKLMFDRDTSELKLGKHFVIKRFQYGEDANTLFEELFYPETEDASEKNKNPVKEAELKTPGLGYAIVNNIKIPLSLRKAMFRTSKNGKKIQVHTEITRLRAKKFKIRDKEIQDYLISKYR